MNVRTFNIVDVSEIEGKAQKLRSELVQEARTLGVTKYADVEPTLKALALHVNITKRELTKVETDAEVDKHEKELSALMERMVVSLGAIVEAMPEDFSKASFTSDNEFDKLQGAMKIKGFDFRESLEFELAKIYKVSSATLRNSLEAKKGADVRR
jgi:hypothetical protein